MLETTSKYSKTGSNGEKQSKKMETSSATEKWCLHLIERSTVVQSKRSQKCTGGRIVLGQQTAEHLSASGAEAIPGLLAQDRRLYGCRPWI